MGADSLDVKVCVTCAAGNVSCEVMQTSDMHDVNEKRLAMSMWHKLNRARGVRWNTSCS